MLLAILSASAVLLHRLHPVLQRPDLLDRAGDDVAGGEIAGRPYDVVALVADAAEFRIAGPAGAAGRAGADHHAGAQGEVGREEVDQVGDAELHAAGAVVLPDLAIHRRAQRERLRVGDLVGGHQAGPERRRAVEVLARAQLVPGDALLHPDLAVAGG